MPSSPSPENVRAGGREGEYGSVSAAVAGRNGEYGSMPSSPQHADTDVKITAPKKDPNYASTADLLRAAAASSLEEGARAQNYGNLSAAMEAALNTHYADASVVRNSQAAAQQNIYGSVSAVGSEPTHAKLPSAEQMLAEAQKLGQSIGGAVTGGVSKADGTAKATSTPSVPSGKGQGMSV